MGASKRTLEEGLSNSANKKGYTGKERHRYIGGAIRNMEKRGEFTIKRKPSSKPAKAASTSRKAPAHKTTPVAHKAPVATPKPVRQAYSKPTVTKHTKLELVVKVNKEATATVATREARLNRKGYPVYSVYYADGRRYGTGTFAKKKSAQDEANSAMYAHNHPKGEHTRGRLA